MRIGIEAQRLFRTKKHGMDIVALELIKSLNQTDSINEYHIFVKKDTDKECLGTLNANFTIHELPSMPYPVWEQVYLPLYIKKLHLDVLHCTANTAPVVCPCKTVVTLHDIIFLESNPMAKGTWYQKFGNLYRRWLVPAVVKSVDLLITVSYYEQKRIMQHFNKSEDKVKVVYNGVGNHFFARHEPAEIEKARATYHLPAAFILFLGNKSPKKNLPNVIRAYDQYLKLSSKPLDLVVLDFPKEELKQFVASEGLSELILEKVTSPGYVKNSELPKLIQAANLFIYPSLRESFGIPILEGMACGIPVITSNTSSMPEVAGNAAVLIDPENVSQMAQEMVRVLDDASLQAQLIARGTERSKEFSWTASALQSIEIYKKVAKK